MKIETGGYTLTVQPVEEGIEVLIDVDGTYLAVILTRDEARMLHTDLGQMLDTFEVADEDQD